MNSPASRKQLRPLFCVTEKGLTSFLVYLLVVLAGASSHADVSVHKLTMRECLERALQNNRSLQIERLNPQIAGSLLSGSYAYYDPLLNLSYEWEDAADTGGFDPADFSRDVVYSAESEVATGGLSGFLPTGLSYNLGGNYAQSEGTRNALLFDSYKLFLGVSVRQPLLRDFWTDAGRTTIRINRANLKISELGVAYVVMDLVNQVQQAYYELAFARANLDVNQRLLAARRETRSGIGRQVEVGVLTVLDERLAQSQVARTEVGLIAASNAVVQAENALKTLLAYEAPEWPAAIVPADPLIVIAENPDLPRSWRRALELRPDFAQMQQELKRAEIDLKYRFNQLFPSVDIVASYGRRGADASQTMPPVQPNASLGTAFEQVENGDAPNTVVGMVFSMPLSRARERATYSAGKQLREQVVLRLKQKEELVLREVSDAIENVRLGYSSVEATRQAREFAAAALQAEEQKLRQGKSSLFFVLQLQGDLASAESVEARSRANYLKALSQWYFAEGTLLDQARVRLDFN